MILKSNLVLIGVISNMAICNANNMSENSKFNKKKINGRLESIQSLTK